jgi:hypothetical protein
MPSPAAPATAAASWALGESLTVGEGAANAFATNKRKGNTEIDRFIRGMLRVKRHRLSTQLAREALSISHPLQR